MKVVHTSELPWSQISEHGKFADRRKEFGTETLRAGLWELPPGKCALPAHVHHITEEALFAVSGHAKIRTAAGDTSIGPGDWVSFPPSGPAHQLVNDTQEPFIYLAVMVTHGFDIVEYPDSGKIACSVGNLPNRRRYIFRLQDSVDYFHGED